MRILFGEWELEGKERRMICVMWMFFLSLLSNFILLNIAEFSVCRFNMAILLLENYSMILVVQWKRRLGLGIAECKFS